MYTPEIQVMFDSFVFGNDTTIIPPDFVPSRIIIFDEE